MRVPEPVSQPLFVADERLSSTMETFRKMLNNCIRTDSNFKSLDTKYGEISAKLTDILTALQTENEEAIQSLNKSVDMLAKALKRLTPPSGQQPQNSTS